MINNPGNILALMALLAWPGVVIVMFRSLRLERALIWSILGGYMILPQLIDIDPPLIPAFDKVTIPNLTAFACCVAIWGRMPSLVPSSWAGRILMGAFAISPVFTVLTNLDPVSFGVDRIGSIALLDRTTQESPDLPGLRFHDSASALAEQLLLMLPLFLAREALRTTEGIREILLALVIAGLIYAPFMLFEIRFSPQLHTILYGYFQHDFIQAIRAGGYRPFVFMPHGLWVAFFALMVFCAALALWRTEPGAARLRWTLALGLGAGLLVICKTMGVILYALVFAPIMLLLRPRTHLVIAVALTVLVIGYPALRGLDLVPTQAILAKVTEVNPDRAQSLGFRFANEDLVLAHAAQRPWLGWGGWGRFVPHDAETGATRIVVDGQWIITIANFGWLGYFALFGLLSLPIWALAWAAWQAGQAPPATVTILTLVLAINLVDLLPNATLIPFTWLIAGALLGHAEEIARQTRARAAARLAGLHGKVVLGRNDPGPAGGRRTVL
jgi:hypothetical protein